jgi:hypothetical protein
MYFSPAAAELRSAGADDGVNPYEDRYFPTHLDVSKFLQQITSEMRIYFRPPSHLTWLTFTG